MHHVKIGTRGQIVIPANLRKEMKLIPGTRVAIQRVGLSLVLTPVTTEFLHSLIGCTKGTGKDREANHRDDKDR